jgi:hypothetical protein
MNQKFSFINNPDIFIDNAFSSIDMGQKLFCTFTLHGDLDKTLDHITEQYTILYDKIFILESPQSEELMCTYNIDTHNVTGEPIPHTILLHRKKESNTLYTINALNTLIKLLNAGILDTRYMIDWQNYRNSILLTNGPDIRQLETTIYDIIKL